MTKPALAFVGLCHCKELLSSNIRPQSLVFVTNSLHLCSSFRSGCSYHSLSPHVSSCVLIQLAIPRVAMSDIAQPTRDMSFRKQNCRVTDRHQLYKEWHEKFGPFVRIRIAHRSMLMVADPAAAASILVKGPGYVAQKPPEYTAFDVVSRNLDPPSGVYVVNCGAVRLWSVLRFALWQCSPLMVHTYWLAAFTPTQTVPWIICACAVKGSVHVVFHTCRMKRHSMWYFEPRRGVYALRLARF